MAKLNDKNPKEDSTAVASPKRNLPLGMIAAFAGVFFLSIATSSGITLLLTSKDETTVEATSQTSELENQIAAMRQSIEQQNQILSAMSAENETLKTYLRHSSSTALKNILLNQEENIQSYLAVMRQAIGDLSDLLPRSSEWETTYQYQMDIALKASMERATLLRMLKTGEPTAESATLPPQSTSNSSQSTSNTSQ